MQPERQQRLHDGDKGLKAMDASHGGSPLESRPAATPLPDKKLLVIILERLQKKDTHGVFSVPVGPNELPYYHEIIKQPMDFGTLRGKLDEELYSKLEEFEADVYLIYSNARHYIPSDNFFFWQAKSILDLAKRLFKNLREESEVGEEEEEEEEEVDDEFELEVEEFELGVEELDLDLGDLEQPQAELEQALGLETDDDDDDYFGEVEELKLPVAVERIVDGNTVHEIEVPVIKDDYLITPSMYRDDIEPTDSKKDYAQKLVLTKELLPIEYECSICFLACDLTSGGEHQACSLPCGHVYGASCIKTWLERDVHSMNCSQCKISCTFDDVTPLRKTNLRIPAVDQKTSTRRFRLSDHGFFQFNKLETARRNVALIKWFHTRNRLDGVLWRMKELMKRRAYLLVRMKASEQKGEAWGRLADKSLQQAKAWKGIAEALRRRAKAYNRRVNAHLPRLEYFATCCENI